MSNTIIQGKVSFVNHEKQYVMIEYEVNGKKKTINGVVDDKTQQQLIKDGLIKKAHTFHIGDIINFNAGLSGRGDKMVASNIQYLYNPALDVLINKAKTENNFIGYLKMAEDKIYVKEIDSYLFFPVAVSPWQIIPTEKELNEAVTFSLENTDNKEKVTAKLFNNNYIPEFYAAVKLQKAKTPVEAEVYKISPHGIYLNIIGDKIQAKIALAKNTVATDLVKDIKVGNKIKVVITYLSPVKIIVEPVL
jgi:ribosomal protein L24